MARSGAFCVYSDRNSSQKQNRLSFRYCFPNYPQLLRKVQPNPKRALKVEKKQLQVTTGVQQMFAQQGFPMQPGATMLLCYSYSRSCAKAGNTCHSWVLSLQKSVGQYVIPSKFCERRCSKSCKVCILLKNNKFLKQSFRTDGSRSPQHVCLMVSARCQ